MPDYIVKLDGKNIGKYNRKQVFWQQIELSGHLDRFAVQSYYNLGLNFDCAHRFVGLTILLDLNPA